MRSFEKIFICALTILLICSCTATIFIDKWNIKSPGDFVFVAGKKAFIHFSIDDTSMIFDDITKHQNSYKSIFENNTLAVCKELHDKYNAVFSFYCFYDFMGGCLKDATDKFKAQFSDNSQWLKFGFHAKNAESYLNITPEGEYSDYSLVINELLRITGSEDCIDRIVRLDRYTADKASVKRIQGHKNGIIGLFASWDIGRNSYYLSYSQKNAMFEYDWCEDNGVFFTPTDIQIENIENDRDFSEKFSEVADQNIIIVFTHEWIFDDKNVQKYLEWFAEIAFNSGVKSDFPQNQIKRFK